MSLLQRTIHLLRKYRITPRKRLGQNFVVDETLIRRMIMYAAISREDIVLEVGAGLGHLTRHLAKRCRRVLAVEIDPRLVRALREQTCDLSNVEIIEGDILKVSVPPFNKVVSTPPYSISSPLLFWLLDRKFDCAVLTFQREFAQRLAAPIGSRDYGRVTVTTYYRAEVKLLDLVPREAFYPPPEVDSRIVYIEPRRTPPFRVENEKLFFDLVRILFTQRNRKVRNAVAPLLHTLGIPKEAVRIFADSLPFHDRRPRELSPEDFAHLSNELAGRTSKHVFFRDCHLLVWRGVYEPAEDTYLIAENLDVEDGEEVLDMGTGCGILAILAAKKASRVVAVDVNPRSVQCAEVNAWLNRVAQKVDVRVGSLFEPLRPDERFDLVLFNAPYLPTDTEPETMIERSWSGGPTGREVIDSFIEGVAAHLKRRGRVLLVQSSLSNIDETLRRFREKGFEAEVVAEKKVPFENIVLIRAELRG